MVTHILRIAHECQALQLEAFRGSRDLAARQGWWRGGREIRGKFSRFAPHRGVNFVRQAGFWPISAASITCSQESGVHRDLTNYFREKQSLNRSLMVTTLTSAGLAGALWAVPANAAGEDTGWYVGGGIGLDAPSGQTLTSSTNGVTNGYGAGFAGGISGGDSLSNGLRPELEFRYQHAGIDTVGVNSPSGQQSDSGYHTGAIAATALLANLWYDYKEGDGFFSMVHPYGGLGVGVARMSINDESYHSFTSQSGNSSGSATTYAYQLGFGVSSDLFQSLVASLDFRYLMTGNFKIGGQALPSGGDTGLDGKYRATSIMVGLKYRFGSIAE